MHYFISHYSSYKMTVPFSKELLHEIFNRVKLREIYRLEKVCKSFKIVANEIETDIFKCIDDKKMHPILEGDLIALEYVFYRKGITDIEEQIILACEIGHTVFFQYSLKHEDVMIDTKNDYDIHINDKILNAIGRGGCKEIVELIIDYTIDNNEYFRKYDLDNGRYDYWYEYEDGVGEPPIHYYLGDTLRELCFGACKKGNYNVVKLCFDRAEKDNESVYIPAIMREVCEVSLPDNIEIIKLCLDKILKQGWNLLEDPKEKILANILDMAIKNYNLPIFEFINNEYGSIAWERFFPLFYLRDMEKMEINERNRLLSFILDNVPPKYMNYFVWIIGRWGDIEMVERLLLKSSNYFGTKEFCNGLTSNKDAQVRNLFFEYCKNKLIGNEFIEVLNDVLVWDARDSHPTEFIEMLVSNGADDFNGALIETDTIEMASYFIEKGATSFNETFREISRKCYGKLEDDIKFMEFILEKGDIDIDDALVALTNNKYGCSDIFKTKINFLVEHGANINNLPPGNKERAQKRRLLAKHQPAGCTIS